MLAEVLHFIEFILVFALVLIALFIMLLIVVSMMPNSNPLKMILTAFAHRVGATAGLMMLDPIATTVPVAGEVWDLATMMWLVYFWYTFFKQLPAMREASSNSAKHNSSSRRPTTTKLPRPIKNSNNQRSVQAKRAPPTIGRKRGLPPQ